MWSHCKIALLIRVGLLGSFKHCIPFFALCCLAVLASFQGLTAIAAEPLPVATAVTVTQPDDKNRIVFDLSSPVLASAFVMSDPDRVIIDLPEISFQIDPAAGQPSQTPASRLAGRQRHQRAQAIKGGFAGATLVKAFRFGLFAPGKSRIVIDLTAPAIIVKAESEKKDQTGMHQFVIELSPTDRASFRASAERSPPAVGPEEQAAGLEPDKNRTPSASSAVSSRPVIVVDPGHGGIDTGANGADGTLEKTIVFDFARSLAKKLEDSGKYQVILTRKTDVFVSLDQRVRIARQSHAALFISIHADTLSDETSVAGATVYTVSDRASDSAAARIAERENKADQVAGVVDKAEASDVQDILFDLTRRETRAYSHVFARTLVSLWKNVGQLNKNPQRSAGFVVLKAPDVPSVLLELGYLSSEKDSAFLTSGEWRDRTSATVAEAVHNFFAPRGSAPIAAPVKNGMTDHLDDNTVRQGRNETGQIQAADIQGLRND